MADESLRDSLRAMILMGEIPPGATVSQVQLARQLGVSTTPLREAMRQLESEGLLEIERNRRARVPPLDLEDLHAVYASRLLLESFGITMTVIGADAVLDDALQDDLEEMDRMAAAHDFGAWTEIHARFHRRLVSGAPVKLLSTIALFQDRSERYRTLGFRSGPPRPWSTSGDDHALIVAAVKARDAHGAARALAEHLARTAIMLSAVFAPEVDPTPVRVAVGMVGTGRSVADGGPPLR